MNRLGFADFHAKHFGPEQQEYWKQFLRNQQQYYQQQNDEQSSQLVSDYSYYYYNHDNEPTDLEEEQVQANESYDDDGLYKEAIEIFRFSEAYRKERVWCDEERLKQEEADQVGKEDWKFDESSVICSGGSEAPATCLVLTQKSKQQSENLRMKEDMLNSEYLSSCTNKDTDTPVVLWPVLPLKL